MSNRLFLVIGLNTLFPTLSNIFSSSDDIHNNATGKRQLKLFDTIRLSCMKSAQTFPNIKRLAAVQTDHHNITELFWKYKSTNFSALGKAYKNKRNQW
jgi:hypothetical protein